MADRGIRGCRTESRLCRPACPSMGLIGDLAEISFSEVRRHSSLAAMRDVNLQMIFYMNRTILLRLGMGQYHHLKSSEY